MVKLNPNPNFWKLWMSHRTFSMVHVQDKLMYVRQLWLLHVDLEISNLNEYG